jgi:chemotaxis protein histidine kinase CheA/ActR/RegA family two-component response regulator
MTEEFDKSTILESFLDEVNAYLPEIEANLDRLQQDPGNSEALEETYRRTHTIGGSAAMMDFSGLARVAQGMEELLGDALDRGTPLAASAIALLRRSHGRLVRLIEAVRTQADDAAIVAEDDADRAASRGAPFGAAPGASFDTSSLTPGAAADAGLHGAAANGTNGAGGTTSPQLPDWLVAFARPFTRSGAQSPATSGPTEAPPQGTDASSPGQWSASNVSDLPTGAIPATGGPSPDASAPASPFSPQSGAPGSNGANDLGAQSQPSAPMGAVSPGISGPGAGAWQTSQPGSGFDVADLGTGTMPAVGPSQPSSPVPTPQQFGRSEPPAADMMPPWMRQTDPEPVSQPTPPSTPAMPTPRLGPDMAGAMEANGLALSVVDELRVDEEAVHRQVSTLRDVVVQLREAAQEMESERTELRSFLDGSREAMDRLEEWTGRQMGLDLQQSPESVRRYLPLSVIWVTTARLKKLVSLLHGSSRSLTLTQEQIEESLGELRSAVESVGTLYRSVSSSGTPGEGFSATIAQFSWAPPHASQPPAVDGSPAAPATEQQLSPAARVELERQVREELRRELEDEVREEIGVELRSEEQAQLRHELEIQVRRQLLADLAPGLGSSAITAPPGAVQGGLPQLPFAADRLPRAQQVTSEQSPEALEVFRDEAQEHLQTITAGIADLERSPGSVDVLSSIRRAMHTLKGAAGMMGFALIQELSHASEDLLERLADNELTFTPDVLSLLFDTSEALDQLVAGAIPDAAQQERLVRSLTQRYARFTGQPIRSADEAQGLSGQPEPGDYLAPAPEQAAGRESGDLSVRLQLSKLDDLVNLFGELLINRSVLEERIDRLSHLTAESVRIGERLREVGGQLESRFEAATLPAGTSNLTQGSRNGPGWMPGARRSPLPIGRQPAHAGEFDELELDRYTEFHRLSRGLSEGVADASTISHELETLIREIQTSFARENRLSSDFQDRLLKARLVPLQSLVPRLYRAARTSALRQGKEIEFFVQGVETEVDRKVFEEVEGPLLHLVRNAVNHGIEMPDERERQGKPRAGRIYVMAAYEGNQVVISVRDDGAGIDPERIRRRAVERGWLDRRAELSQQEAIDLIFRPGYSTAETVTEESGRGVGLDVVRDVVTKLRGTVEVESSVGQGTFFTMKFPISLQIARSVLVRVGQQTLAIPMAVVQQIGRLDYYQHVPGQPPSIEVRGERYPLMHLASYLKLPVPQVEERSSVLLVNSGKYRVALLVDAVVSQQEVVSKPLGAHLRDVPGVAGATVLGNGQVVLILELHELLAQPVTDMVTLPEPGRSGPRPSPAASQPEMPAQPSPITTSRLPTGPLAATWTQQPTQPMLGDGMPSAPQRGFMVTPRATDTPMRHQVVPPSARDSYVLVVDDSPSVRRVVGNMLKANGWQVQTARDGVEALEVIARQRPAVVLLDIEMPRMDGYELMATVRAQEQYRTLPLVVLTSRAATKHQQRAMQLGANAYIVKPYQDEDLLKTLAELASAQG